jgi:hypothetical protein
VCRGASGPASSTRQSLEGVTVEGSAERGSGSLKIENPRGVLLRFEVQGSAAPPPYEGQAPGHARALWHAISSKGPVVASEARQEANSHRALLRRPRADVHPHSAGG